MVIAARDGVERGILVMLDTYPGSDMVFWRAVLAR
jgi:hypothetical protein